MKAEPLAMRPFKAGLHVFERAEGHRERLMRAVVTQVRARQKGDLGQALRCDLGLGIIGDGIPGLTHKGSGCEYKM